MNKEGIFIFYYLLEKFKLLKNIFSGNANAPNGPPPSAIFSSELSFSLSLVMLMQREVISLML